MMNDNDERKPKRMKRMEVGRIVGGESSLSEDSDDVSECSRCAGDVDGEGFMGDVRSDVECMYEYLVKEYGKVEDVEVVGGKGKACRGSGGQGIMCFGRLLLLHGGVVRYDVGENTSRLDEGKERRKSRKMCVQVDKRVRTLEEVGPVLTKFVEIGDALLEMKGRSVERERYERAFVLLLKHFIPYPSGSASTLFFRLKNFGREYKWFCKVDFETLLGSGGTSGDMKKELFGKMWEYYLRKGEHHQLVLSRLSTTGGHYVNELWRRAVVPLYVRGEVSYEFCPSNRKVLDSARKETSMKTDNSTIVGTCLPVVKNVLKKSLVAIADYALHGKRSNVVIRMKGRVAYGVVVRRVGSKVIGNGGKRSGCFKKVKHWSDVFVYQSIKNEQAIIDVMMDVVGKMFHVEGERKRKGGSLDCEQVGLDVKVVDTNKDLYCIRGKEREIVWSSWFFGGRGETIGRNVSHGSYICEADSVRMWEENYVRKCEQL